MHVSHAGGQVRGGSAYDAPSAVAAEADSWDASGDGGSRGSGRGDGLSDGSGGVGDISDGWLSLDADLQSASSRWTQLPGSYQTWPARTLMNLAFICHR